jgi:hypothetical protein
LGRFSPFFRVFDPLEAARGRKTSLFPGVGRGPIGVPDRRSRVVNVARGRFNEPIDSWRTFEMSPLNLWTRRDALRWGVAAALAAPATAAGEDQDRSTLGLVLTETAGLRRFSYPVHALLPGVAPGRPFRLSRVGRAIPAQFRTVVGPDGQPAVALDFASSTGPLESEHYLVETGQAVEPGPEPARGLRVEQRAGAFDVQSGSALHYTIDEHLAGFLKRVSNSGRDYLAPEAGNLAVRTSGQGGARVVSLTGEGQALSGTITRQGPFAVGLRFTGRPVLPDAAPVTTTFDLTFPSTKSWVEVQWTVDDAAGSVAGLVVALPLKLEGEAALVDLGTEATIYGVLRGRESMTLAAGSFPGQAARSWPWVVFKGPPEKVTTFAQAPRAEAPPAEGWAHVMDVTRCTALAVADFGREAVDRIKIDRDGRVQIARDFASDRPGSLPPRGPKTLRFWFHFVPMPVQIGAATSPQAMLAPLEVTWERS